MTAAYYPSADAERRAKEAARETMREVETVEAEIAARTARLSPYRRRVARRRPGIVSGILFALASRIRALAAYIRRRNASRFNMRG